MSERAVIIKDWLNRLIGIGFVDQVETFAGGLLICRQSAITR
jgi:hypothetical protein